MDGSVDLDSSEGLKVLDVTPDAQVDMDAVVHTDAGAFTGPALVAGLCGRATLFDSGDGCVTFPELEGRFHEEGGWILMVVLEGLLCIPTFTLTLLEFGEYVCSRMVLRKLAVSLL